MRHDWVRPVFRNRLCRDRCARASARNIGSRNVLAQNQVFTGRGVRCSQRRTTRGIAHDANLGRDFDLAEQFVANALHVEIDAVSGLRHKIDGAEFQGAQRRLSPVARLRADDHDGPRLGRHDLLGHFQPAFPGHVDVHGDDVGIQGVAEQQGLHAVASLAHHVDLRIAASATASAPAA